MTVPLAFTIAGYNLEFIRSFEARAAVDEAAASGTKTRAKRREGTWAALLGTGSQESGRDPPPDGETLHLT